MVKKCKYLLDSDIVIAMLRDSKDRTGLRRKALNVGLDNCYVSSITIAELSSGAHRMSSERGLYEVEFIKTIFNTLPFGLSDSKDAELSGLNKALLLGSGTPISDMDMLIGSSAISHDLIIVTHNVRHFSHIPKLQIEDWLSAGR